MWKPRQPGNRRVGRTWPKSGRPLSFAGNLAPFQPSYIQRAGLEVRPESATLEPTQNRQTPVNVLRTRRTGIHDTLLAGLTGLAAAALAAAIALLMNSCATAPRTVYVAPFIPGANYSGNQACLTCHSNYVQSFAASPHARVDLGEGPGRSDAGCESCHGPGSLHISAGGGRGKFIHNPARDPTACLQCHLHTQSQFQLVHHHPVPEGHMNCVQCHDPHGLDIFKPAGGLAMARLNENCAQCHRDQTRPVTFEHEAMREGCTTCHNPHGSINRKLLTQADPNMCLRCHAQNQGRLENTGQIFIGRMNHTALLSRGTCWSSGCHTAVHGSNVDPHLRY